MKKTNRTANFPAHFPWAKLLRILAKLAVHPVLWLIPVLLFAGVLPHPASRSETVAAAFLSAFPLILAQAAGKRFLFEDVPDAEENTETVPQANGGKLMHTAKFRPVITRLGAAALTLMLLLPIASPAASAKEAPVSPSGDYRLIRPWAEGLQAVAPDQREGTGIVPENTRESYNVGSCRQLKGDPFLLVIFLEDDVSSWREDQVHTALEQNVMPAIDFMESEARVWGVSLDVHTDYRASYRNPDRPVKYNGVIKNYSNGTSRDLLDQTAASLGYSSKEEMHEKLMAFTGRDQIGYVFMVNKGGRSYCTCYSSQFRGSSADYQMEYAVVFSGFTDDSNDTGSDTVVHEVLHMFGAEDYYYPDCRKFLARQYYPKDIMLCAMPALEYAELGDFTAYTIGWTDREPAICSNPNWW